MEGVKTSGRVLGLSKVSGVDPNPHVNPPELDLPSNPDLNPPQLDLPYRYSTMYVYAVRKGSWTAESAQAQHTLTFETLYDWLKTQHERGKQCSSTSTSREPRSFFIATSSRSRRW